jgi:hypothetical protein
MYQLLNVCEFGVWKVAVGVVRTVDDSLAGPACSTFNVGPNVTPSCPSHPWMWEFAVGVVRTEDDSLACLACSTFNVRPNVSPWVALV